MPSSSRALRRSERVRGLIPSRERSSSQKRSESSARSRMIRRVHLPEMTSAVRQTGHSRSITRSRIPAKLYFVKRCGPQDKRLARALDRDPLEIDLVDLHPVGLAVDRKEHILGLAGGERQ